MGLGRAAAPSGRAWPGREQRLGMAGCRRKRETTCGEEGGGGAWAPYASPRARPRGAECCP